MFCVPQIKKKSKTVFLSFQAKEQHQFHEEAEESGDKETREEETGKSSIQQGTLAKRANIQERLV